MKPGVHANIMIFFIPLLHQSHHWAGEQRMPAFLFLGIDLGGFIFKQTLQLYLRWLCNGFTDLQRIFHHVRFQKELSHHF